MKLPRVTIGAMETVVRYRTRVGCYYVAAVMIGLFGVILLFATLGYAVEAKGWKKDFGAGLACFGSALFAEFIAWRLVWKARVYSRALVAVGPGGVRMRLVNLDGTVEWGDDEVRFAWDDIGGVGVDYEGCRFTAVGHTYMLSPRNCPSPGTVARLLQDRKGAPTAHGR